MGTRGLTMVQVDGEMKVANYGQWDHYPSGQGVKVLAFVRYLVEANRIDEFADKARAVTFLTPDEINVIDSKLTASLDDLSSKLKALGSENRYSEEGREICKAHWLDPDQISYLSRDLGADILHVVLERSNPPALQNSVDFAGDGLFCEYAYLVNLDEQVIEVYEGFGKEPLRTGERFKHLDTGGEYRPVREVYRCPFDAIPTDEEFLKRLEPKDEDD